MNITNIFNKIKDKKLGDEEIYRSLIAKGELTNEEENILAELIISLGITAQRIDEDLKAIEKIRNLREVDKNYEAIKAKHSELSLSIPSLLKAKLDADAAYFEAIDKRDLYSKTSHEAERKHNELKNIEANNPLAKYA